MRDGYGTPERPAARRQGMGLFLAASALAHALLAALALFWPFGPEREPPPDLLIPVEITAAPPPPAPAPPEPSPLRTSDPPPPETPKSTASLASLPSPGGPESLTAGWRELLLARVRSRTRYPDSALSQGREGTVMVKFTMDRLGKVIYVRLLTGSGHQDLDDAALAAVRTASPLPPVPRDVPGNPVAVVLPVSFSID